MRERFVHWTGVGVLTAGLGTVVLTGTATAAAAPASGPDSGAGADSSAGAAGAGHKVKSSADPVRKSRADGVRKDGAADPSSTESAGGTGDAGGDVAAGTSRGPSAVAEAPSARRDHRTRARVHLRTTVPAKTAAVTINIEAPTTVSDVESAASPTLVHPSAAPTVTAQSVAAPRPTGAASATDNVQVRHTVAAEDTATVTAAATRPNLLNVIGSVFFGMIDLVVRLFEGAPAVPADSTVRVGRSSLQIDCGNGYTTKADWYYPTDGEPQGLIYFQHGFLARAGMYNATAAELAEETNSIVFAPTISTNLFDCYGCQMGAEQMQAAIAKLFVGDRTELTASARAALGIEDLVLPQRYVVVGHSEGALAVPGVAGWASQYAATSGTPLDLAGVIMLEVSAVNPGPLESSIAKIPDDVPVLAIQGDPSSLNDYGSIAPVLEQLRPGQFHGVQLADGVHSDGYRTTNAFAQFVVGLMNGFSKAQNVDAVRLLAGGWINDMFAGTGDGIYGSPGQTLDIGTDDGTATAYVLPGPVYELTFFDKLTRSFYVALSKMNFAGCAVPVDVSAWSVAPAVDGPAAPGKCSTIGV